MSTVQEYWDALPRVTKSYLTLILGTTALTSFGFVSPFKIILHWDSIWSNLEIWRIFTNFGYFGKPSFSFLFQLMIIGRFGSGYENDPFSTSGKSATSDFLFALGFNATLLVGLGIAFQKMILGPSLIFAMIYLWSRRNPDAPVSVWGFRFTGSQVPWVFIAMNTLMGGDPIPDIMGLVTSHLFYFLIEVLPLSSGINYLSTPGFLDSVADHINGLNTGNQYSTPRSDARSAQQSQNPWASGTGNNRQRQSGPTSTGYQWGRGRRLGDM